MDTLHETSSSLFPPSTQIPILSYPPHPQDSFTAIEMAAAEQLVQLSVSSSGGDSALRKTFSSSSFSSYSSSPRSVNTRPAPAAILIMEDEEEEIGGTARRKRPRYRSIDDLYVATAPIDRGREKRGNGEQRREKRRKAAGLRM